MDPTQSPKTPTKSKSNPINDDLRQYLSEEKPRHIGFMDQMIHDTFEHYPPFLTQQKYQPSQQDPQSQSYLSLYSSDSQSDHHSHEQEKFQTVKKLFEPQLSEKDDKHLTTARQNHKGCNCGKSKCQKNYCVCFKMGNTCSHDCECNGCQNHVITVEHLKNEKIALEMLSNSKQKGCNCKNSNCQKNYCICHQNGNKCSQICRCENCHNMEEKGKQDREQEKGVARLMFTARKRVKVSEFEFEQNKQNMNYNN